ncbi:hypothetical protein POTOM_000800 [Populus tomentosa]|uniref:FAD/NAD(P)-binding domain-containing protein n=1 Tax=Populus tomentosa TaxID=118781 RepID=A0A8X8DGQ8_POPTO|nr:hypothetical protein POTOM_000800 [Populus tomentosa]
MTASGSPSLLPPPRLWPTAGYAARSFVEHGMADGRLCIVTREGFHTCVGSGGERQTPDWYKEKGIEMLYEDPVTGIDIEKQTATTISGKLLKYGTLIVATGCTASRFPEKIGGNLPGVHYIRDVADADSLISSLERAHKLVIVGGGYIGMEVAAAAVAWKLDTTGASIKNLEASSDGHVAAVIIGIGAKPAVGPFERLGLNNSVGGIQEFQLLPELAKSQPTVDKSKLQSASSVEEALEIARASLQAAV